MITTLQLLRANGLAVATQALLEAQGDRGFGLLYDQVRSNGAKETCGFLGTNDPHPDVSDSCGIFGSPKSGEGPIGYAAPEGLPELLDDAAMAHGDFDTKDMADRVFSLRSDDGDAAISIEETCCVFRRHDDFLSAYDGMMANSGELRCPVREDAEGQSRAKQERGIAPGVCNEHVPSAKAKMCSELHGNMQRAAEMTAPTMTCGYCASYNTMSSRNKFGDRQCPTGRAYFIRTSDSHMLVDPRFLFEWTGPLTYPDQYAFTRLCGVRLCMRHQRRMFQAVLDGVTA